MKRLVLIISVAFLLVCGISASPIVLASGYWAGNFGISISYGAGCTSGKHFSSISAAQRYLPTVLVSLVH